MTAASWGIAATDHAALEEPPPGHRCSRGYDPGNAKRVEKQVAVPIEREIRRFLGRVRRARFLGGLCEALLVIGLGLAALLVALRLFGVAPQPSWWWCVLLLPAVLWAAWGVRRLRFGRRSGAVHLDRRLGLDGLLVTSLERSTAGYETRLRAKLDAVDAALPRMRVRPALARIGVVAAVLAIVFLLPAPVRDARAANPILAETLDEYEERLAALEETEGVREEMHEELTERLDDLKQRFAKTGDVAWKDLDAFEQAAEHERALHAARLAKSQQDLAAFARGDDEKAAASPSAAAKRMAELLQDAKAAGLTDKLPEALRKKLGAGEDMSGADLEGAMDAETMKQLAAALAQSAGDKLSGLEGQGLPEGIDPASLEELLAGEDMDKLFGEPCGLCKNGDKDCPG